MRTSPFSVYLQPEGDGSFTSLRLFGSVVTALPPCEIGRWIRQLAMWSGSPVELALPVEIGTAGWFELWTYAVSDIPARHLQLRFRLHRPHRKRGQRHVG
jgi:hypothetical protein